MNGSASRECNRARPRYISNSRDNSRNRYSRDQSRNRGRRSRTVSKDRENRPRSRSSSRVSTNKDRLRCYRCNEYDHFVRECPNVMSDEDSDQEDGAILQLLAQEEQRETLAYSELEDLKL